MANPGQKVRLANGKVARDAANGKIKRFDASGECAECCDDDGVPPDFCCSCGSCCFSNRSRVDITNYPTHIYDTGCGSAGKANIEENINLINAQVGGLLSDLVPVEPTFAKFIDATDTWVLDPARIISSSDTCDEWRVGPAGNQALQWGAVGSTSESTVFPGTFKAVAVQARYRCGVGADGHWEVNVSVLARDDGAGDDNTSPGQGPGGLVTTSNPADNTFDCCGGELLILTTASCTSYSRTTLDVTLKENACCECDVDSIATCVKGERDYCFGGHTLNCDQLVGNEAGCDEAEGI